MHHMSHTEKVCRILEGAQLVFYWKTCLHSDPTFAVKWEAWSAWREANPDLIGDAWAIERDAFNRALKD